MLLEIRIRPESPFGSLLKGDTLFGHFCWQIARASELINGTLDEWIQRYPDSPFAIFSSAWPLLEKDGLRYALRRPDLPPHAFPASAQGSLEDRIRRRKADEGKEWMLLASDLRINLAGLELCSSRDLDAHSDGLAPFQPEIQAHNTIHRSLGSTAKDAFAPFSMAVVFYRPGIQLALFAWIDSEALSIEQLREALGRIGQFGYGRDASTGCGRFRVESARALDAPSSAGANACYALSPVLPEPHAYRRVYHRPFVRFGRHGDALARSRNPYKNPVLMADEGAVLVPKSSGAFEKPYMGRPVTRGLSLAMRKTVLQGYSLYLPFQLEAA